MREYYLLLDGKSMNFLVFLENLLSTLAFYRQISRENHHTKCTFSQFFPRLCLSILRFTSSHHQLKHLLFSDNEAAILLLYFDVILPFSFFLSSLRETSS